jgi:hypothetical protein
MTVLSDLVLKQEVHSMQSHSQQSATDRILAQLSQISAKTLALVTGFAFLMLFLVMFLVMTMLITPPAQAQGMYQAQTQPAILTPKEVVEYALTLEKLEAEFYRRAIEQMDNGTLSTLPEPAKAAIRSYGEDEALHVPDLSAALRSLGGNPDAVTITSRPNFSAILNRDAFANPQDFLLALQRVEDTGVAAYKGQVQNLQAAGEAGKGVLAAALEIHTIEARHAVGVRNIRQRFYGVNVRPWIRKAKEVDYKEVRRNSPIPFEDEAFDGYATKDEVLAIVGPILAGT